MKATIFYSWQSDLPAEKGRMLIQHSLSQAIGKLMEDAALVVRPELDHDTEGVPGAPAMVATILRKIDECSVFVADVTPTFARSTPGARKTSPNPNVLIELGYALKRLSRDRVLLLLNTDHGPPEELPFDLRGDRIITFATKHPEALTDSLRSALQLILTRVGLPADVAPPVLITLKRINRIIGNARHDYRLPVIVANRGEEVINDWTVEVVFPGSMLPTMNGYPIVRTLADGNVVMRQTADRHSGPLFPGEERELLGIDYFMDGNLFHNGGDLLDRGVTASFFVGTKRVATSTKTVRDLQIF